MFYVLQAWSILRTASEQLQNGLTPRAAEQLDMGETMHAFVELWNEHSRPCVAIVFARILLGCHMLY